MQGEDRKEGEQIRRNFQGVPIPPLVHTGTTAAKEYGHFPHQIRPFPKVFFIAVPDYARF